MEVHLRNLQRRLTVDRDRIRLWAFLALESLDLQEAELGLLLVGDRRMRRLNRVHRGQDRPTNVLSFPIDPLPPGRNRPHLLGDVVISLETAQREAKEAGIALPAYLQILLVHGILHLIGLDHERSAREAQKMAGAERRLLRKMGRVKEGLIPC